MKQTKLFTKWSLRTWWGYENMCVLIQSRWESLDQDWIYTTQMGPGLDTHYPEGTRIEHTLHRWDQDWTQTTQMGPGLNTHSTDRTRFDHKTTDTDALSVMVCGRERPLLRCLDVCYSVGGAVWLGLGSVALLEEMSVGTSFEVSRAKHHLQLALSDSCSAQTVNF